MSEGRTYWYAEDSTYLDPRELTSITCWACGQRADMVDPCSHCGAPAGWWTGPGSLDGVYVIEDCTSGLWKIGYSVKSTTARIAALNQSTPGRALRIQRLFHGAERDHEQWLHIAFARTNAREDALALGLPAATEWFYASDALHNLALGVPFIEGARP